MTSILIYFYNNKSKEVSEAIIRCQEGLDGYPQVFIGVAKKGGFRDKQDLE